MRVLMIFGAILGMLVAVFGAMSMRSDIQVIIALIGFFSAFILFGMSALFDRR